MKNRRETLKKIFFIFFIFSFLFFFWQGIYWPKEPHSQELKIFLIKKGQGSKEISINLEKDGLIKFAFLFRIYVIINGTARKLQAGEYQLSPSMNIPEIAEKLASGEVIKEKITIIEGWNLKDIAYYLERKGLVKSEEFLERTKKDFSQDFSFLKEKPKNLDLEGYLFPDTYQIKRGETTEEIIRKMLQNFNKKLSPDLRKEIEKQGKTVFEIITMASLIEKEVYNTSLCPECKKLVSGILWKRLKIGMPLQVDATISYIIGKKTTEISIEETKIDSPYNTYKYRGLPLGPITNPGLESILAAVYPENSDYWYYLSTTDGKTIFSKTLTEHNLAKARYLK